MAGQQCATRSSGLLHAADHREEWAGVPTMMSTTLPASRTPGSAPRPPGAAPLRDQLAGDADNATRRREALLPAAARGGRRRKTSAHPQLARAQGISSHSLGSQGIPGVVESGISTQAFVGASISGGMELRKGAVQTMPRRTRGEVSRATQIVCVIALAGATRRWSWRVVAPAAQRSSMSRSPRRARRRHGRPCVRGRRNWSIGTLNCGKHQSSCAGRP